MKKIFKRIIKSFGYEISKFPSGIDGIQLDLMKKRGIDLVLDVGANSGQYSKHLRDIGYSGDIISFEPLKNEFKQLALNAKPDTKWKAFNIALGNENKVTKINIAGNSYSSSFLEMNKLHIDSAPHSKYIGDQQVEIKKLDTFIDENPEIRSKNIFLKMDVQGFEKNVILGAEDNLLYIKGMQLELSFEELYKGETLFDSMVEFLKIRNFNLCLISPEFSDPLTNKLLQVNTIFFRM